ncbi:MAG: hypothetical protein ABIP48_03120 [Planctomycetota bacterium]
MTTESRFCRAEEGQLLTAVVLLGVIIVAGVCRPGTAGEHEIVLKEHVSRRWTNELLSYPFEAAEGACRVDSVTLRGPEGPEPVQLSDVEYWPATRTVKSAMLWLVADLAPLAANVYTVGYQAAPSTDAGGCEAARIRSGARRGGGTLVRWVAL